MKENSPSFTKERLTILALWFGALVGVRLLLGTLLESIWIGTVGAIAITFVIFYLSLRLGPLQKYRLLINSSLALWYRRRLFYVTGAMSMLILASILLLVEYGHENYGDKLITMDISQENFAEAFRMMGSPELLGRDFQESLKKHSALEIIAVSLASADKNLSGHYSTVVSYMFAEDIEVMIFLTLFRSRREIFAAPKTRF